MAITTVKSVLIKMAQGKGVTIPYVTLATVAGTAAATASGGLNAEVAMNSLGTVYPGTLQSLTKPSSGTNSLLVEGLNFANTSRHGWLGYFYLLGTVDLTATGDKFTHSSTFSSLQRTRMGVASQPINMMLIANVTTATSVTAPAFILKTVAGGSGYTDQSGNGVVGTLTFTFPAAATVINSSYWPMLEAGSSGVQDLLGVDVTIASTTGVLSMYGFEPLVPTFVLGAGQGHRFDAMYSGTNMVDMQPAVPNSGSVTSFLGILGNTGAATYLGNYSTVTD